MRLSTSKRAFALHGLGLGVCLALAACGGGGGGTVSTPRPTPSPSPSPTPTPTPTTSFDTEEYQRSDGPEFHGAITAWEEGFTGDGQIIAVIDTGIDRDSPEFRGRIHPRSADLAGNSSIDAVDDHGTNVAMVAAAARDDTGILGIAFDAQLLVLRTDRPGSCTPADDGSLTGCQFFDRDIAVGINRAVNNGATVINISLGGNSASQFLLDAVANAAAQGVVIVVAAGNGGGTANGGNPGGLAQAILDAGGSNVIIVGSVGPNGRFSSFSNRAGDDAASFLSARGELICCTYRDGELDVQTDANGNQTVTLFSGTSFSAPQVAGAVALLAQAFPNLTGEEIVEILLDTARDAGAAGTDRTFGRGILDIAEAVSPQGTTTIPGSKGALAMADDTGTGSAAMGDALGKASIGAILLDKYDRAYGIDIGSRLRGASIAPRLEGAVQQGHRNLALGNGQMSMAFTVDSSGIAAHSSPLLLEGQEAERARVLAGQMALKVAPGMQLGFAFSQSASGIAAHLQGRERPAFMIAGDAMGDTGFLRADNASFAIRQRFGELGLTMTATSGDALLGNRRRASDVLSRERERYGIASIGVAADRRFGPVQATLGFDWLQEDRTILGGYFHDAFGARGADTLFLETSLGVDVAPGWWAGFNARGGYTRARRAGMISGGSDLTSSAWSADLVRRNLFQSGDMLGLRVSQPLRVEGGGLNLTLPVSYDYATESAGFGTRSINLSPEGREIMGELAWRGNAYGGELAASAFYRRDPGHYASISDDQGVVVRWLREF